MFLLVFVLVSTIQLTCAGITVSKVAATSAEVRWEVDNYPMPKNYDLLKFVCSGINVYRDTSGNLLMDHSIRSQFFPAKSGYGLLDDLAPYANYTCNAYANRDIDSFEFHTTVAAPVPPKQPKVTKSESDHHWKYTINLYNTSTVNGPITGYEIQFHCIDGIPMDILTSPSQEHKYVPFKGNILTAVEAQQSTKPVSFYLRAHRMPLPDKIVINQKLLHGAIKKDSAYVTVVTAYSHNEHGHLLYSHSPPSSVISMPSKYVVKNDHVMPDPQLDAPSAATTDMLDLIHSKNNHHYIERAILIVLLSILPVVTSMCLLCVCLVLYTSKGKRKQKKKQNKKEYELERKHFLSPSSPPSPVHTSRENTINEPQKAFNVTSSFYDTFSSDPTNFIEDEYDTSEYHSTNPFLVPPSPVPKKHSTSSTKKSSSIGTPPVCPPRRSSLTHSQTQEGFQPVSPPPRRSSLTIRQETPKQSSPLVKAAQTPSLHSASHSTSNRQSGSSNFLPLGQITEEAFIDLTSQTQHHNTNAAHQNNQSVSTQTQSELSGQTEAASFNEVASVHEPPSSNNISTLSRNSQHQSKTFTAFSDQEKPLLEATSSPVHSLPFPPPHITTYTQAVPNLIPNFENSAPSSERAQSSQPQMQVEISGAQQVGNAQYASQQEMKTEMPQHVSIQGPINNDQSAHTEVNQTSTTQTVISNKEQSIGSSAAELPPRPSPKIAQQYSSNSTSSYDSNSSSGIEYNTSREIAMYTEPYTETGSVRLSSTDPNPRSTTNTLYSSTQSNTSPTSSHSMTKDDKLLNAHLSDAQSLDKRSLDERSEMEGMVYAATPTPPLVKPSSSYNAVFSSSSSSSNSSGPQSDHAPDLELQFSDLLLPIRPSLSLQSLLSASPDVELNSHSKLEVFHHDGSGHQSIGNQASTNKTVSLRENVSNEQLTYQDISVQEISEQDDDDRQTMPQYSNADSNSFRYSEDDRHDYIIATPLTTNRNTTIDGDHAAVRDSDQFSNSEVYSPVLQRKISDKATSISPRVEKIQPSLDVATQTSLLMPQSQQKQMKKIETQTSYKHDNRMSSSSTDTFSTIKQEQSLPSFGNFSIETQHYFVNPIKLRRAIQGLSSSSSDSCSLSSTSSNEVTFAATNINSRSASPAETNISPFMSSSLESFAGSLSASTGCFVTPQSSMDDGFCTPASSLRNYTCTTPEGSTQYPFISPSCSAHASHSSCLYTTPEYYLSKSEDYDQEDIQL